MAITASTVSPPQQGSGKRERQLSGRRVSCRPKEKLLPASNLNECCTHPKHVLNLNALRAHNYFWPVGAAPTAVCGLVLLDDFQGHAWETVSYDCLLQFGARELTNRLALILIDETALCELRQVRFPCSVAAATP
jgi:hypothetical protein